VLSAINKVNSVMAWVGIVSVPLLVLLIARDVFMRYVLNSPTGWMLEVAMGIQLLYGLFCAGYVLQVGGHVRMQLLSDRVSKRTRAWMFSISSFIGIFVCGTMVYYAWQMAAASLRMGELTGLTGYPVFFLKLMVVIGFALLGIQFIAETYKYGRMLKGGNFDEME
jgi:TRAP-type mannitol/chloroaromatic compound transport system permease small subunit